VVGDWVGIASTSYNGRETDKREISKIDNADPEKPILHFTEALTYRHYAEIYKPKNARDDKDFIDMRCEVGVLSRNVRYRGNPEDSVENQYGATIFMHSPGDDSLTNRLSNVEFNMVG